jgi:hypothetical protein
VRPVPGRLLLAVAGDLGGELGGAGAMSSVADTYTRWVCTVRREMYCRSPICGLVRPEPLRAWAWCSG